MLERRSSATRPMTFSAMIEVEMWWMKKMRKPTLATAKTTPQVTERKGTTVT